MTRHEDRRSRDPDTTLADITKSAADQGVVVLVVDIEELLLMAAAP